MKEGKADNEHSNPVLLPLVPEFTNICISHLQLLHFQKFFVRSRRDWEKKCRMGIRHSPSSNRYSFAKTVAFSLCPFCNVIPTPGERGVGGILQGRGGGGIESMKWWWWEMMMWWITFYILYTMAFWGLEGDTLLFLTLLLLFGLCLLLAYFALKQVDLKNSAPNLVLNGNTGGKEGS